MRLLLAAIFCLFAPVMAQADTPATAAGRDCFQTTSWRGWSAPTGQDALLLRVRQGDVYRVDLTPGSRVRTFNGDFLINEVRGSGLICSPIDLDLRISDQNGFSRGLIATGLRKLTAEEVAALSPKDRP